MRVPPPRPQRELCRLTRGCLRVSSVGVRAQTVEKALALFDAHCAKKLSLPADLRLACYGIAVARRGAPAFVRAGAGARARWRGRGRVTGRAQDWLWNTFKTVDFSEEQRRCLVACGRATDPALLARLMQYSVTEIRTQDTPFVLAAVGGNGAGRGPLLEFMKANWPTILRLFGGGQFLFSSIVGSCTSNFDTCVWAACCGPCGQLRGGHTRGACSKEKADEVLAFFASNPAPAAERKIRQSVETVGVHSRVCACVRACTASACLRVRCQTPCDGSRDA